MFGSEDRVDSESEADCPDCCAGELEGEGGGGGHFWSFVIWLMMWCWFVSDGWLWGFWAWRYSVELARFGIYLVSISVLGIRGRCCAY